MSDLNTMFQNGMGSLAAIQMGRMRAQQEQEDEQKLLAMKLANEQNAAMNPLNQQFMQGRINEQSAQLPGVQAQTSMLQDNAKASRDTLEQQIATKLSSLQTQIGDDGMKRMGTDGQKLTSIASLIQNVPAMNQQEALQKAMKHYGLDPDQFKQFTSLPPEAIVPSIQAMGKGMSMASFQYQQQAELARAAQEAHMRQAEMQRASAEKIAGGNNATALEIARMNNEARMYGADSRQQQGMGKMSSDQMIAYLTNKPDRTPEEEQALNQLKQQRLQERAAGANALPAQLLGMQSPQDLARGQAPTQGVPQSPPGYKQIGTSKGRPVYEDAQGRRFIGK